MKMARYVDVAIIGGGINGLFTAYEILRQSPTLKVVVIEMQKKGPRKLPAMSATKNMSQVAHTGALTTPNTLRSKMGGIGFQKLIEFLKKNNLTFSPTKKMIVAYNEEEDKRIEMCRTNAIKCGRNPEKSKIITGDEARNKEPILSSDITSALWLEQCGMFDMDQVIKFLESSIKRMGGTIFHETKVLDIIMSSNETIIRTTKNDFSAHFVANNAAANAYKIAGKMGGAKDWTNIPILGQYLKVKKESIPLNTLIYCLSNQPPFLGEHGMPILKDNGESEGIFIGPTAMPTLGVWDKKFRPGNTMIHICQPSSLAFYARNIKHSPEAVLQHFFRAYFARLNQKLFNPEALYLKGKDLTPYKCGIRAQKLFTRGKEIGKMSTEFQIETHKNSDGNVIGATNTNPGSPGATAAPEYGCQMAKFIRLILGENDVNKNEIYAVKF
jgi:L-2-hydroxyglutarate oxidase